MFRLAFFWGLGWVFLDTFTLQVRVVPSDSLAVMVQEPAPLAVTLPPLTEAILALLEDQVTLRLPRLLTIRVKLSPTLRSRLALFRLAFFWGLGWAFLDTFTLQVRVVPSDSLAVMVQLPTPRAVTLPALTEATLALLEDQVTLRPERLLTISTAVWPTFMSRDFLFRLAFFWGW